MGPAETWSTQVESRWNGPSAIGIVAWIIIAPEMLAGDSLHLPWRTRMTAFIDSGSSVAIGLSSGAM